MTPSPVALVLALNISPWDRRCPHCKRFLAGFLLTASPSSLPWRSCLSALHIKSLRRLPIVLSRPNSRARRIRAVLLQVIETLVGLLGMKGGNLLIYIAELWEIHLLCPRYLNQGLEYHWNFFSFSVYCQHCLCLFPQAWTMTPGPLEPIST